MTEHQVAPNFTYQAHVSNIVSGEIVELKISVGFNICFGLRIRLARIHVIEELQEEAKRFLIELVFNKDIIVRTKKTDSMGIYLAEIFYFDENHKVQNLSDQILKSGIASICKSKY